MNWTRPLDFYCERHGPGFWQEPMSAWTNLAFWVAAYLVYRRLRHVRTRQAAVPGHHRTGGDRSLWSRLRAGFWAQPEGRDPGLGPSGQRQAISLSHRERPIRAAREALNAHNAAPHPLLYLLVVWLIVIGIASFCFHTFAQPWAALADVASIAAFVLTYLYLQLRAVFRLPLYLTLPALAGFALLSVLAGRLFNTFLGVYSPTLLTLIALSTWNLSRRPRASRLFLTAAGVFATSMAFATLDGVLCPWNLLGTHWLWHLCNAAALTLGCLALLDQLDDPRGDDAADTTRPAS